MAARRKAKAAVPDDNKPSAAEAKLDAMVEKYLGQADGWLDEIANGRPTLGKDGKPSVDSQGNRMMQTKGDPVQAMKLFLELIEYRIPKRARVEHSGTDGKPINLILSGHDAAL